MLRSQPSLRRIGLTLLLIATTRWVMAAGIEEVITRGLTGEMRQKEGAVAYQAGRQPEVVANVPQTLGHGDTLRTFHVSRAVVHFESKYQLRVKELTILQILPLPGDTNGPALQLQQGGAYFSTLDRAQSMPVRTPNAHGVPEGTEFLVEVDARTGTTAFTMFDGSVSLTTAKTNVTVPSGQQGIALADGQVELRPILKATNVVQWWIYYPGILDPDELGLSLAAQTRLSTSLAAYRSGDLHTALKQYRDPLPPDSETDAERTYYAGLLLSVGAVDRAQAQLNQIRSSTALPGALRTMIHAVRAPIAADANTLRPSSSLFTTATEWLAVSYAHQATNDLRAALASARAATTNSPGFGFAWARVAELEFSFANTRAARAAVQRALALTPNNAQAHALNGFLLAAQNRLRDALASFDRAISIDPALGNAWLGRGLCKRRLDYLIFGFGASAEWQRDLQTAAILEPTRSLVRSYAGKAFAEMGDSGLAHKELNYAKRLDTNDPTPWLYSALLNREENHINDALRDLENSFDLNDNRAVYRSRLLLDQDRAVRSSSLANVYQTTGMEGVAVREAARAVSYDYGNFSAHLFLSESFDALRDPTRFNLRYETVWLNELLLASLLSPVGGTPLSQHISQQEYARLFEGNRIGLTTDSSYRSDGQYRELASQFGVIGNTAWSLDLDYQHNNGVRPNNELDRIEWYSTLKQQLTAQDSVLLMTRYYDYHSGDNFQYFDPQKEARPHYNFDEFQKPIALVGYHREWAPGVHSLALGGVLNIEQHFNDDDVQFLLLTSQGGTNGVAGAPPHDIDYENKFEAGTVELNQVLQTDRHTLVFGGRYQRGRIRASNLLSNPYLPVVDDSIDEDFERATGYAYYSMKITEPLVVLGGIAYDSLRYPANFRDPPIAPGEAERDQLGPKAAVTWTPTRSVTLRGAYSRSLSGVMDDHSFRLEPTQLAGFVQTYRTIIPESVASSISGQAFETAGLALDVKLGSRTYLGLQGERLSSDVVRDIGVREAVPGMQPVGVSSTPEELDFLEHSAVLTLNQILADDWAFGLSYRFTRSELRRRLPEVPVVELAREGLANLDSTEESDLHQVGLFLLFNHPSGLFARAELNWYFQVNRLRQFETTANTFVNQDLPGDEFPQFNLAVGYRFWRQRGDISLGLLNVTGEDYHLNPLNFYSELPRERVFYARLRFRF